MTKSKLIEVDDVEFEDVASEQRHEKLMVKLSEMNQTLLNLIESKGVKTSVEEKMLANFKMSLEGIENAITKGSNIGSIERLMEKTWESQKMISERLAKKRDYLFTVHRDGNGLIKTVNAKEV